MRRPYAPPRAAVAPLTLTRSRWERGRPAAVFSWLSRLFVSFAIQTPPPCVPAMPPNAGAKRRAYGYSRVSIRGNGMVSRMCDRPQIHATVRSSPSPKPECGTEP